MRNIIVVDIMAFSCKILNFWSMMSFPYIMSFNMLLPLLLDVMMLNYFWLVCMNLLLQLH